MKRLISGALISLFSLQISAQRDFRPGFVILNNGDTVKGSIHYKATGTAVLCTFRAGPTFVPTDYNPYELAAFRFDDGKFFVSRMIESEPGPKKVFLEFLLKGKLNLYYMRDGSDHYYIEKENGRLIELTEKEKIQIGAGGTQTVRPSQFEGKLRSVMADCPAIYPEINRTGLNHSSLIRLGKDYHEMVCTTEQCIVFERQKKPFRISVGLLVGYTFNRLKFGSQKTREQNGEPTADYGQQLVTGFSPGMAAGARLEFVNIFSTFEHVSVIVDFEMQRYSQYRLTATGETDQVHYEGNDYWLSSYPNIVYIKNLDVDIKTWMLKVPLRIRYTFRSGSVRPYLSAGVMNMLTVSQNEEFQLLRFTEEYGKSVPSYHFGLTLAAGSRIRIGQDLSIFVEGGYDYTQNYNVTQERRLSNSLFVLRAGISLF